MMRARNRRICRWVASAAVLAGAALQVVPADATGSRVAGQGSVAPLAAHVDGQLIVSFKSTASAADRARALKNHGAKSHQRIATKGTHTELVSLAEGVSVQEAMASYKADPTVRFAEPDYLVTRDATSNDPLYVNGSLWGMQGDASIPANQFGTGAAEAWAAGYTGSSNVVVGVIDEGIQITHPDLAANIWVNPNEIAGNGVDDDINGFVDDVNGWDFFNGDASVFDGAANPAIDAHGTHVSGTIGGVGGNGQGVAGVNWSVKIISAKFLGPNGGSISAAVSALNYLVDLKVNHGVNLVAVNNSWGGGGYSQAMSDSINAAGDQGVLFIAAAGNSGTNNDTTANYPSNYDCTRGGTRGWDCVVAVAAIDSSGALASFSQYGATTVDLGAPGVGITSSVPNSTYSTYNGTSMATPHVTGAAALCASMDPSITGAAIRNALVASAAPTASLSGRTVSGGRLDIGAMMQYCLPASAPVNGAPTGLTATPTGTTTVGLSWTDGVTDETRFDIERAVSNAGTCGAFAIVGQAAANATSYNSIGMTAATDYCFRVRGANSFGGGSYSPYAEATARTNSPPPPYVCTSAPYAWVDATVGGSSFSLADDGSAGVVLPFTFGLYGDGFTTASIASNGYLRLGSGSATAYANVAIPSAADPNNMIAAWWDDLNPASGGSIWSRTVGSAPSRQFVVSWNGVPHYGAASSGVSFQIVLDEASGDVVLQYLDTATGFAASDHAAGATIGIENSTGTAGTQVSYNSSSRTDLSAVRCSSGPIVVTPVSITTSSFVTGVTGTAYSQNLAAAGGTPPYTWALESGTLPAGLSLNATSGVISGTPTAPGTASFVVRVTDSAALTITKPFSITITAPLVITTASLPDGTLGTAYNSALAASGGTPAYAWSLASGTLPAGLALSASTGAITGTPTTGGTTTFTVRVTDATSVQVTKALSITIDVSTAPSSFNKTAPTNGAKNRSRTSLTLSWGTSNGASRYEYCVDSVNDNVCNGTWLSTGTSRSVVIGGLSSRTRYYWQVRAVNGIGITNANTGTWWNFTTS